MRLHSVIKRILSGPTIHKLVCFRITEDCLKRDYVHSDMLTIKEIYPDILDKVLIIRNENVRNYFEKMMRDSIIILAEWKGEIAGHAILSPDGVEAGQGKMWRKKEYIHYCYVTPQYRGKGIYPCMLNYLAGKVFENHAEREVYISAGYNNYASIRGIEKAGFVYWANLTEYGWGGVILIRRLKRKQFKDRLDERKAD